MASATAQEENASPTIMDTEPTSATRGVFERRNSLEKHLQQRPEAQDLKNRHILLDTSAAPALQATQAELERQKKTDQLKKSLEHRTDREILIERNILSASKVAPTLLDNQRVLERHMRANSLEQSLRSRPTPDELIQGGILEANENPLEG